MATIRKIIDVETTPEAVWAKVSDVANLSKLIGFVEKSELEGNQRICTTVDGAKLVEKIISVDDANGRVVYSITQSPLDLDFHVAVMEITPASKGTRLTWTVDLLPDTAAAHMEPMLDSACADMQKTLNI